MFDQRTAPLGVQVVSSRLYIGVEYRLTNLHCLLAGLQQLSNGIDDVFAGQFREHDDAGIDHQVGIGAIHAEQIGKAGHAGADVNAGVILPPVMKVFVAAPDDLDR
jgi:hypothetical protein